MDSTQRKCTKCQAWKASSEYYKHKKNSDKLMPHCKSCDKEKSKKWREANKDRAKDNNKKWVENNKEYKKQKDKEYRIKHWEKKKVYTAKWKRENYQKLKNDPSRSHEFAQRKIKYNISRRIREILGQSKSDSCLKYTGCSLDKLKIHLEKTMDDGMHWMNYGESKTFGKKYAWHIDHIIPCDAFDFNNPVEKLACFHYKNLRACWWDENIIKHAKYNKEDKQRYIKWFIDTQILYI